jgi:hypothetical protein
MANGVWRGMVASVWYAVDMFPRIPMPRTRLAIARSRPRPAAHCTTRARPADSEITRQRSASAIRGVAGRGGTWAPLRSTARAASSGEAKRRMASPLKRPAWLRHMVSPPGGIGMPSKSCTTSRSELLKGMPRAMT